MSSPSFIALLCCVSLLPSLSYGQGICLLRWYCIRNFSWSGAYIKITRIILLTFSMDVINLEIGKLIRNFFLEVFWTTSASYKYVTEFANCFSIKWFISPQTWIKMSLLHIMSSSFLCKVFYISGNNRRAYY